MISDDAKKKKKEKNKQTIFRWCQARSFFVFKSFPIFQIGG